MVLRSWGKIRVKSVAGSSDPETYLRGAVMILRSIWGRGRGWVWGGNCYTHYLHV